MKYSVIIILALLYFLLPRAEAAIESKLNFDEQIQSLSTIPNVLQHRDPFVRAPSPYAPLAPTTAAPEKPVVVVDTNAINPNDPDLLRYPASQYKVMAILLGDVYPRALLRTPDNKVFVVRENDKLGKRHGYIRRVQEGAIVVVEETKTASGALGREETRLALVRGETK